jgi:hypothetical protein
MPLLKINSKSYEISDNEKKQLIMDLKEFQVKEGIMLKEAYTPNLLQIVIDGMIFSRSARNPWLLSQ